jgi:hypothetical protein
LFVHPVDWRLEQPDPLPSLEQLDALLGDDDTAAYFDGYVSPTLINFAGADLGAEGASCDAAAGLAKLPSDAALRTSDPQTTSLCSPTHVEDRSRPRRLGRRSSDRSLRRVARWSPTNVWFGAVTIRDEAIRSRLCDSAPAQNARRRNCPETRVP